MRRTAVALVPVVVLLAVLAVREYDRGGIVTGDTFELVSGTAAVDDCLHARDWRCHEPVGKWPPLQYFPTLAAKRLGASRAGATNDLVLLNGLAVLATLAVLWLVGRKLEPRLAPVLVLAGLVSPLLWYGAAGFEEPLAALATAALAASLVLGGPAALGGVALAMAVISKETALPFLLVLAALALLARGRARPPRRAELVALGAGAAAGVGIIVALNLFRYGVPWNEEYVRSGWAMKGLGRRAEFFAAGIVAPNAGIVWFWPVAAALFATAFAGAARGLRAPRSWRDPAVVVAGVAVLLVLLLATLAGWWSPFGWNAFGDRLIVPWVPALLIVAVAARHEPLAACVARWLRSRIRLIATGAALIALGLGQIGAFAAPFRPLDLFLTHDCPYVPHLMTRIADGDEAAHREHAACMSHEAWRGKQMLIHSAGGAPASLAVLYGLAVLGLLAAAATGTAARPSRSP